LLQGGELLVSLVGNPGEVAIVPSLLEGANIARQVGLVPLSGEVDVRYVMYFLMSPVGRAELLTRTGGAVQQVINLADLKTVKIPLPSMQQQGRIADILATYDHLIENNRRRMVMLEDAARQLYREWFVRLRFPGHEHTPVVDGVPVGWRRMMLDSLTSRIRSGATPRGGEAAYVSEGVSLFRSQNVYDDRFEEDGLAFIDEEQAAALAGVTVHSRDILLNITGASVARCCMAPDRYLPARVNQHVMIVRVDSAVASPFFVHAAINSDTNKRTLLSYAQKGSTREALTKEMISGFEITLASDELMREFHRFAEDCFTQRENLAAQNQKLRAARNLLLPRLMNGEITV
jgi:type I restriction enzyme S subunit